jgi:hypothetical protein
MIMMENYVAPQIELLRFDVYEIMESGASGEPSQDTGGDQQTLGEAEPW